MILKINEFSEMNFVAVQQSFDGDIASLDIGPN